MHAENRRIAVFGIGLLAAFLATAGCEIPLDPDTPAPNETAAHLEARGQLMVLNYEAMLRDPRTELGRVLDFLGLSDGRDEILAGVAVVLLLSVFFAIFGKERSY